MSHEQEKGRAPGFNRRRSSYKPLVVKEGVLTEGEVSRARTHHRKSVAGGTGTITQSGHPIVMERICLWLL